MMCSHHQKGLDVRGQSLATLACVSLFLTSSYPYAACAGPGSCPHRVAEPTLRPSGLWAILSLSVVPGSVEEAQDPSGRQAGCSGCLPAPLLAVHSHHSSRSVTTIYLTSPRQQPVGPAGAKSQPPAEGHNGNWPTFVETALPLHPWSPDPMCVSSPAGDAKPGGQEHPLDGKLLLKHLPPERANACQK